MRQKQRRPLGEFIRPDDKLLSQRLFSFHISRYAFASQYLKDKLILDVACGSGYGSRYLSDKGAKNVIGGDISGEAIGYAKSFYKKEGVEFILLDAIRLPFPDNSFDTIVSLETIEHLKQYEIFLSECSRILKDGGIFICSTPNREVSSSKAGKPSFHYHFREFSIRELVDLLSAHFGDISCYGQGFAINKHKLIDKLAVFVKSKAISIPKIDKLINLVTTFALPEYHVAKLEKVNLDNYVSEKYWPSPLEKYPSVLPENIIAVARKV